MLHFQFFRKIYGKALRVRRPGSLTFLSPLLQTVLLGQAWTLSPNASVQEIIIRAKTDGALTPYASL